MFVGSRYSACIVALLVCSVCSSTFAQAPSLNNVRSLGNFGQSDQQTVSDWINYHVNALQNSTEKTAFLDFKTAFDAERLDAANSLAFLNTLTAETVTVAQRVFAQAGVKGDVARALARALLDLNKQECVPAFLAGLKCQDEAARFLCVKGLIFQNATLSGDRDLAIRAVGELKATALAEANPVILKQIYSALAITPVSAEGLEAYWSVLDKRLEARRQGARKVDGAELSMIEFFRSNGVVNSLNPAQKSELAKRLATLMRLDANRYQDMSLGYPELEYIERQLDGVESVFEDLTGNAGGIRQQFRNTGSDERGLVMTEVFKWIGNAADGSTGTLNSGPWNVPVGAP